MKNKTITLQLISFQNQKDYEIEIIIPQVSVWLIKIVNNQIDLQNCLQTFKLDLLISTITY